MLFSAAANDVRHETSNQPYETLRSGEKMVLRWKIGTEKVNLKF